MAGGKETPRQKMIGMMYLVLTALLALNVAKTILDAFVAIEENIQLANINEVGRGDEKFDLIMEKATGNEKTAKAEYIYKLAQEIDAITAKQIQLVDQAKLLVLMECKEKIETAPESDEKAEAIVVLEKDRLKMKLDLNPTKPGVKNNDYPIRPIRMNLHHVEGKDKYDEGMRVMGIASDEGLMSPEKGKHGDLIWNAMITYRNDLCKKVVDAANYGAKIDTLRDKKGRLVKFSFTPPADKSVEKFSNKGALMLVLEPQLKPFFVDGEPADEYSTIKDIYLGLTKSKMVKEGDKDIHWIGKTFDHAPSVAVLASLSSIQKDILSARAVAISYLQEKVGAGEYSFNKVMALAYPDQGVVNGGEEFTMSVLMAAFDSERQPVVVPDQGTAMTAKQGVGVVKLRAPNSGEMKLSGTVTIRKKNGSEKTERYEAKVMVVPPMGTVTLPEFSIMYAGYTNKVTAVAGGSKGETNISVQGGISSKKTFTVEGASYNGWTVKPSAGSRQVVITVQGKDSQGNSKSFGTFKYRVKPFPSPKLLTPTISLSSGARIQVGLGQDCPISGANFTIKGGNVLVGDGIPYSGPTIPGSAIKGKVRAGKTVAITISCVNSLTGLQEIITGSMTVKP
jgi:hypothetical protein